MSLFRRLLGRGGATGQEASGSYPEVPQQPQLNITQSSQNGPGDGVMPLSGTTTFGAEALADLFASRGLADGGILELDGWLVAEPDNPSDPKAIAVEVEGRRIGYLPGYLARHTPAGRPALSPCQVQLWSALDRGRLRAIGWVSAQKGAVAWPHDASNPPAITIAEQRAARAASTTQMVDDALSGANPTRKGKFLRGMVGGYHYLETAEPINQLKRQGRLEEALALCYGAIDGAEADRDGREPAPWYTEQAAIIHRKLGQRDEEIAVLQRWLSACPPDRRAASGIKARLDKLLARQA